jgi:hypothetical protein
MGTRSVYEFTLISLFAIWLCHPWQYPKLQPSRRAATVEACAASPVAETADQDRKKAEVVINAIAVLRMTTAR